jgi:hypothetical protein
MFIGGLNWETTDRKLSASVYITFRILDLVLVQLETIAALVPLSLALNKNKLLTERSQNHYTTTSHNSAKSKNAQS